MSLTVAMDVTKVLRSLLDNASYLRLRSSHSFPSHFERLYSGLALRADVRPSTEYYIRYLDTGSEDFLDAADRRAV